MLLWALSPLPVYVAVVCWEAATRPGTQNTLQNAVLGLSLISAFLIVPWIILCAVAFGSGLILRRLLRGRERRPFPHGPASVAGIAIGPAPVEARASNRAAAIAPTFSMLREDGVPEVVEWRMAHTGLGVDGFTLNGLDVWAADWRPADAPDLRLASPAYPDRVDRYPVYEIGGGDHVIRFAAAELSGGVWGFYVPTAYSLETVATTADGSLRFEQRTGEIPGGRPDAARSWAALVDAATGRTLVDGAAWLESRISSSADGSLLLRLRKEDGDVVYRIDPTAWTFRDVAGGGPARPLHALRASVDAARSTGLGDGRHYRRISPDGTICVDTEATEWRSSDWVHAPRVTDLVEGRVVVDLWGTHWFATIGFPGERRVSLDLHRYRVGGGVMAELDLGVGRFRIASEASGAAGPETGPLAGALSAFERHAGRAAAAGLEHRDSGNGTGPRGPFAAWRTAILILLAAFAVIATMTALSMPGARPVHLDRVPQPIVPAPMSPGV